MPPEAPERPTIDGATALVRHLRVHPEDAAEPGRLAAEFALPEGFVRSVLASATRPRREPETVLTRRMTFERPRAAGRWCVRQARVVAANPGLFVAVTSVLWLFAVTIAGELEPKRPVNLLGSWNAYDIAQAGLTVLLLFSHWTCYYRAGQSRHPIFGGATVWLAGTVFGGISAWFDPDHQNLSGKLIAAFFISVGVFAAASFYACVGLVLSLLGGYARTRRQDRQEEEMDRADLLERYFELQRRLERGSPSRRVGDWLETSLPSRVFRASTWPVAIGGEVGFSLFAWMLPWIGKLLGASGLWAVALLVAQLGVVGVYVLFHVGIGLFAGRVSRALLVSFVAGLAGALVSFLPLPRMGVMTPVSGMVTSLLATIFAMSVTGCSALAAEIQRKAARDRRLEDNDPEELVAEMIRLQWRLSDDAATVCVMAVDAAKSTLMKAAADPLDVEFSFREYQEWLAGIARRFEGEVVATAGDGAIVQFPDCDRAFRAARRLQTDVERFNRDVNRLAVPFRLRVGMHVGQVVGRVRAVQFTEVIDIAAHVEGIAPVGGIAVTDEVVKRLEHERFLPLAAPVDGHDVAIAAAPTED